MEILDYTFFLETQNLILHCANEEPVAEIAELKLNQKGRRIYEDTFDTPFFKVAFHIALRRIEA